MTWRRVALYWVLFGVALAYFAASIPVPGDGPTTETAMAPPVVPVHLDRLAEVEIERAGGRIRVGQEAGHWRVLDPAGLRIPADLIATFVVTLAEATPIEQVAPGTAPPGFGLEAGATRVAFYERGHEAPVRVVLGAPNPTRTAIYAEVEGQPGVVLLGRVLAYYADRLFEEIERPPEP